MLTFSYVFIIIVEARIQFLISSPDFKNPSFYINIRHTRYVRKYFALHSSNITQFADHVPRFSYFIAECISKLSKRFYTLCTHCAVSRGSSDSNSLFGFLWPLALVTGSRTITSDQTLNISSSFWTHRCIIGQKLLGSNKFIISPRIYI